MDQWSGLTALMAIGLALLAPVLAVGIAAWACWGRPARRGRVACCARCSWVGLGALVAVGALLVISPDQPMVAGWVVITPLSAILAVLVQGWQSSLPHFPGATCKAMRRVWQASDAMPPLWWGAGFGTGAAVGRPLGVVDCRLGGGGRCLQPLLCFYGDRPFALLAAQKRLADRVADGLLVGSAALAWYEVGGGSLTQLAQHVIQHTGPSNVSMGLQASAVCWCWLW